MLLPTISSKIVGIFQTQLANSLPEWLKHLTDGRLDTYEAAAAAMQQRVYNEMSQELLSEVALQVKGAYKCRGGSCVVERKASFRLRTGAPVVVPSLYFKRVAKDHRGSRNLMINHWNVLGANGLGLCDRIGYLSSLCPSYETAHQALEKFGVKVCLSSVRDLTNNMAELIAQHGEENVFLSAGESLSGKTVIISMDGGRSRMREYNGKLSVKGYDRFETPWREPKLFIIDILDDQGKYKRTTLPIYGCRFDETEMIDLLARYLRKLDIDQATHVQLIADGAQWIWNRVPEMLFGLGVDKSRLTQTIDHYHALGYLHKLVNAMPRRIGAKQRKVYLNEFKNQLWEGQISKITNTCKAIFQRMSDLVKRWINYFDKHDYRMQYADFEKNKLLKGSGLIESGVRRIINLRFKNTSTFWRREKVEKLYAMRAGVLSKRWVILMENLATKPQR
jgi:hypothetical protein